jgi:hypothetical protein
LIRVQLNCVKDPLKQEKGHFVLFRHTKCLKWILIPFKGLADKMVLIVLGDQCLTVLGLVGFYL